MKSILYSILALVVIGILAWLGWVGDRSAKRNMVLATAIVAVDVRGNVGHTVPGQAPARLAAGEPVVVGAEIVVSAGSSLDLASPNGDRLRIAGPAKFIVDSTMAEENRTFVELLVGKLTAFVAPLAEGQSFTVKTPTAVAGVRGTVFQVDADQLDAMLSVARGVVEFRNTGGDSQLVEVKGGKQIRTRGAGYSALAQLDQVIAAEMIFVESIPESVLPGMLEQMQHIAATDLNKLAEQLGLTELWQMPELDLDRLKLPQLDLPDGDADGEKDYSVQVAVDQGYIYKDLKLYAQINNGKLPDRLSQTMMTVSADPWGQAYIYKKTGNDSFRLLSAGPDMVQGTDDDIVWRHTSLK